jgi:hypothetical protein
MERHGTTSVFWLAKTKNGDGLNGLKKDVNDMNMMLTPATNGRAETRKETNKIQPSVIDHITHDIVNQLSVISLCCCELRNSVAEKLKSDQLKQFERIEIAVQNAADMIQQLKAVVQDHGPTRTDRNLESALNRTEAGDHFYAALSRFLLRR